MTDVDFTLPDTDSLIEDVLTLLKARDEHLATMDFGSDTNLPVNSIRRNTSTQKLEKWDGTTWALLPWHSTIDSHIADTSIHQVFPTGAIVPYAGTASPVPPNGWLLADGSAVSRSTYSALFTICGVTYGAGDGSTTFNLPNLVGRLPFGKDTSGTGATLGSTFGTKDHAHSESPHTHTIPSHSHSMNHAHQAPAHVHAQTAHVHGVAGHYHDTQASGATISINSSGSHSHEIAIREATALNSPASNIPVGNSAGTIHMSNVPIAVTLSDHIHSHANFTGLVGSTGSGVSGDSTFNTNNGTSGSVNTASAGNIDTSGITVNYDGSGAATASVALTTNSGNASQTGTANPPSIALNFLIKT